MIETPKGNRLHIGIFGRRNAGKSSLINALTNQDIALVSDVAGTTTDPVYKTMEILPIGPVMIVDTAGLDDEGDLGELRIKKTLQVLNKIDIALIVVDSIEGISKVDIEILNIIKSKNIPTIGVLSKIDTCNIDKNVFNHIEEELGIEIIRASSKTRNGINELKEAIIKNTPQNYEKKYIVGDLINKYDYVVLVTPIDKAAPKGRLILPQQQTIRDIIDSGAVSIVTRDTELKETLKNLGKKPALVITDSQAFKVVDEIVPVEIPLTSFSILFARYKADLKELVLGIDKIKNLKENDKVLVCEGCTHHKQQGDIGKDKIPKWIEEIANNKLDFEWSSGVAYPSIDEIYKYSLIVHCGGCMLNPREMQFRVEQAKQNNIPIVNYGVLIGHVTGVLDRALQPFPNIRKSYRNIK
jgi:[FeFe] hydrogenase H-cluster maturation GTPase HydF